jgi:plastocyanin
MRRLNLTLAACATLLTIAGCGSSGGSSSRSSAATSSSAASSTQTSESVRVTTTPKFAAASGPVRSGTVAISYHNIAIAPDTVRVKVGSTIKWTNYDDIEHNVTSEGGPQKFASKDFGLHGTFEIKALKPGVIHYECTIHPASMNGTIDIVK